MGMYYMPFNFIQLLAINYTHADTSLAWYFMLLSSYTQQTRALYTPSVMYSLYIVDIVFTFGSILEIVEGIV